MTALANLSKFTGCYNEWLKIRQRYNMKWSKGDSIASFERFFDDELNYDVMLQRVRVPDQTRGKQKGIKMDMSFCCKIHASHLRQCGIKSEIVDLLQDRVPRTVFDRNTKYRKGCETLFYTLLRLQG